MTTTKKKAMWINVGTAKKVHVKIVCENGFIELRSESGNLGIAAFELNPEGVAEANAWLDEELKAQNDLSGH